MSANPKSKISPISDDDRENYEETTRKLWKNYQFTNVCEDPEEKLQTDETLKKKLNKKSLKHHITNKKEKISFNILIDEKLDHDLSTDVSDKTDSNPFPLTREDCESSLTQPTETGSDVKGDEDDKLFENFRGLDKKLLKKLVELFDCKYVPQSILFRNAEAKKIDSFVRG